MRAKFLLAASLSLTLAACSAASMPPLAEPARPATAIGADQAGQQVEIHLDLGGFGTKVASLGQLAFVKIEVVGQGITGTLTHDGGGFIPVSGGTVSATVSNVPIGNDALRVVTLRGYDSNQSPLAAFELAGYYKSRNGVGSVSPTLSRHDVLLAHVLKQALTNNPALIPTLDLTALETALDTVTGYDPTARKVFQTDPSQFDPVAIMAQLPPGGGPLPDANTLTTASRIPLQPVNLNILTPTGKPLGKAVTLTLDDPNSLPQQLQSGTFSNTPVSFANVPWGNWTLRAFNDSGQQMAQTAVTVQDSGVTIAQSPLTLIGAVPGYFQSQLNGGDSSYTVSGASVAIDPSGNHVLVWTSGPPTDGQRDLRAQRYDVNGNPIGAEFQVNTTTDLNQGSASVAMDAAGNFAVVWESEGQDGSLLGIFGQRYQSNGSPIGGEFQVNSWTTGHQHGPRIAMNANGNFVVVWESEFQDGSGQGIYGQVFDNAGNPVGSEFQANTTTDYDQNWPQVALNSSGGFVVTWTSDTQTSTGREIFSRRYDSGGNPLSDEFQVNSWTTGNQRLSDVAIDSTGNFLIAWSGRGDDSDQYGIFAQRYDNSGNPLGNEFRVDSPSTDWRDQPAVAMDSTGDFAISWNNYTYADQLYGIKARRYNSSGSPLGEEFQVNTTTDIDNKRSEIALADNGDFVIGWETQNKFTGIQGIAQLRFDAAGNPQ